MKSTLQFVSFTSTDNCIHSESPGRSTILSYIKESLQCVLTADSVNFKHQLCTNTSLQSFLCSYLNNRYRPYEGSHGSVDKSDDSSNVNRNEARDVLYEIDQQIALLYMRLYDPSPLILQENNCSNIQQYSTKFNLQELQHLRLTSMIDLVSILGDNNRTIASHLLTKYIQFFGLTTGSTNFQIQLESILSETSTIISDLITTTNNYFPESDRTLNDDNSHRDRRTLKVVTLRKKPKQSWQEKSVFLKNATLEGAARKSKFSQLKIENVEDMMNFVKDIVMSLSSFLYCLDKTTVLIPNAIDGNDGDTEEDNRSICCANGRRVGHFGLLLFQLIQQLNDIIINNIEDICVLFLTKKMDITSQKGLVGSEKEGKSGSDVVEIIGKIQSDLSLCRKRLVEMGGYLVDACIHANDDEYETNTEGMDDVNRYRKTSTTVSCSTSININNNNNNNNEKQGNEAYTSKSWLEVLQSLLETLDTSDPRGNLSNSHQHTLGYIGSLYAIEFVKAYGTELQLLMVHICGDDGDVVSYLLDAIRMQSTDIHEDTNKSNTGDQSALEDSLRHVTLSRSNAKQAKQERHHQKESEKKHKEAKKHGNSVEELSLAEKQLNQIESVSSIFPDLNHGYLYACFDSFDWNNDRTIDALLNNNLPPAIVALTQQDRNRLDMIISKLKMSIQDKEHTSTILEEKGLDGKEIRIKAKYRIKTSDIQETKTKLLQAEEKEEEDFYLLRDMHNEYADDYDDQYDDVPVSLPVQTQNDEDEKNKTGKGSRKVKGKKNGVDNGDDSPAVVIDWSDNWAESGKMKRLNTLIRQEEEERAFWQDMKNDNFANGTIIQSKDKTGKYDHRGREVALLKARKDGVVTNNTGDNEDSKDTGNEKATASAKQGGKLNSAAKEFTPGGPQKLGTAPNSGATKGKGKPQGTGGTSSAGANAGGGGQKKPRTKTFDKHRQKDKALRKGGA